MEGVFTENFSKLKDVAELDMDDLAAKLFTAKIIPAGIRRNPTFDKIISSFEAGLKLRKTNEAILTHCKAFLNAFDESGGPLSDAAEDIKEEIKTKVKDELGVAVNLS